MPDLSKNSELIGLKNEPSIGKRTVDLLDELNVNLKGFVEQLIAANSSREVPAGAFASLTSNILRCQSQISAMAPELQLRLDLEHAIKKVDSVLLESEVVVDQDVRLVNRAYKQVESALFDAELCLEKHKEAQMHVLNSKTVTDFAYNLAPYAAAPHNISNRMGVSAVSLLPEITNKDDSKSFPQVQTEQWPIHLPFPTDADISQSALFTLAATNEAQKAEESASPSATAIKPVEEAHDVVPLDRRSESPPKPVSQAQLDLDLDLDLDL